MFIFRRLPWKLYRKSILACLPAGIPYHTAHGLLRRLCQALVLFYHRPDHVNPNVRSHVQPYRQPYGEPNDESNHQPYDESNDKPHNEPNR